MSDDDKKAEDAAGAEFAGRIKTSEEFKQWLAEDNARILARLDDDLNQIRARHGLPPLVLEGAPPEGLS